MVKKTKEKINEATQKDMDEWYKKELKPWGDRQLSIVALMAFVQLFMLGLMFGVFWLNSIIF